MSLLDERLADLYAHLTKRIEGSNKFYNIYVKECSKGMAFCGSEKRATQDGYEVYSFFGGIGAISFRQRHVGFYFHEDAAFRSAKRLKETKLQKRYTPSSGGSHALTDTMPAPLRPSGRVKETPKEEVPVEKVEVTLNFHPIPQPELKRTATQRKRFSNLGKLTNKE